MPAVYDSASERATTKAKAKPKRKVIYAPQIKATKKSQAEKATTLIPGLGAVKRPAAHKPAPPRNADTGDRARSRPKPKPAAKAKRDPHGPFSSHPVQDTLAAQRRAVQALSELRAQDPKKYDDAVKGRAYAGARGQTVEHYKGKNTREALASIKVAKPKDRPMTVAGFRGQTKPTKQAGIPGGEMLGAALQNAPSDAAELLVSMPTSIAHQAKTLATDPKKFAKEQAQPYIDIAKHPVKEFTERPVSTALTVQPFIRGPFRAKGALARKRGTQTLARPDASLPGTSLKETSTGSRSSRARNKQAEHDAAHPTPVVRAGDVKRRVDEHHDFRQQKVHQAGNRAAQESHAAGHDQETARAHIEAARKQAHDEMDVEFAREFGAHQRPSVGAAEKRATKTARKQAEAHHEYAKEQVKERRTEAVQEKAATRTARGAGSPRLTTLEAERRAEAEALAAKRAEHTRAELEHAKAHGSARVSVAKPKKTDTLRTLHGQRKEAVKATEPQAVKDARAAVSDADRHLAHVSRKGLNAVPDTHETFAVQAAARQADRTVAALERQLAKEEERASRLEGVTEGRQAAGRMTAAAGRATVDQAEKIGLLKDELRAARKHAAVTNGHLKAIEGEAVHTARQSAKAARTHLRETERAAHASARETVAAIDRAIAAEHRRVAGVAPEQADRLRGAIDTLDDTGAGVRARRSRVRELGEQITEEGARLRSAHAGPSAAEQNALIALDKARTVRATRKGEAVTARDLHVTTKQAAANAALVGGGGRGRVFAHRSDANKVVERLNAAGHELIDHKRGRKEQESIPLTFKVREVDGGFSVIPEVASERMYKTSREGAPMSHQSVGTSPNTVAKAFRVSRRLFTQATLPLNPKWLFGQGAEAGVRGAIAGAGPLDLIRFNRVVKEMNAKKAGSGDDLKMRVMGGQFGLTGPAREFAQGTKTLAEEFAGTGLERPARALTRAGANPPMRAVRAGWKHYTGAVLGSVNGFFESNARKAMAGQAIKSGVFNEKRFNALSDAAIEDAAKGLRGTEAQVALARQVDRMYGQYQKFSPEMRSSLLHTTPFLPWYLNSIKFLGHVLPVDHPYITSLMAAASTTTEDWRKEHHLSTKGESHRPEFLMGGYPFGPDEKIARLANFTPWGVASDPVGSAGSVFLPQVLGPVLNAAGVDWTGNPLRDQDYKKFSGKQKAIRAGVSALEAQVPGVAAAGRLTGLTKRYVDKKDPEQIEPFSTRLLRELPLVPVGETGGGGSSGGLKVKPIKVKPVKAKAVKPIKVKAIKIGG